MSVLYGFRHWKAAPNNKLSSVVAKEVWTPQEELTAQCSAQYEIFDDVHLKEAHESPDSRCMCGIYGYKTVEQLARFETQWLRDKFIFGQVALWGIVDEYEFAYRAEKAYPYCLYSLDNTHIPAYRQANLEAIAKAYAVDIVPAPKVLQEAVDAFCLHYKGIYSKIGLPEEAGSADYALIREKLRKSFLKEP